MSTRLDDLLGEASADPEQLPEAKGLWAAGRRRRRWRRTGAVTGGLALVGLAGGAVLGVGLSDAPQVDIAAPPPADPGPHERDGSATGSPGEADEEAEADETDEADEPADPTPSPTEPDDPPAAPEESQEATQESGASDPEPGPEPDPAAMAEPCAGHPADDVAPFIDLVAPVEGQRVEGAIELAGCARVFEATVRYRVLDGAGGTLVDDVTTATAGGPQLGEFAEVVHLGEVTGEVTLEVFWDDVASGGEQDLTAVQLQAK